MARKKATRTGKVRVFRFLSEKHESDLIQAKMEMSKRFLPRPETVAVRLMAFRAMAPNAKSANASNVVGVGVDEKYADGIPTGVQVVKFLVKSKLPGENIRLLELGKRKAFTGIRAPTNGYGVHIWAQPLKVTIPQILCRICEAHDPVESARPPKDGRVKDLRIVRRRHHDHSILRCRSVQAVQKMLEAHLGFRTTLRFPIEETINIFKHDDCRGCPCGRLEQAG